MSLKDYGKFSQQVRRRQLLLGLQNCAKVWDIDIFVSGSPTTTVLWNLLLTEQLDSMLSGFDHSSNNLGTFDLSFEQRGGYNDKLQVMTHDSLNLKPIYAFCSRINKYGSGLNSQPGNNSCAKPNLGLNLFWIF